MDFGYTVQAVREPWGIFILPTPLVVEIWSPHLPGCWQDVIVMYTSYDPDSTSEHETGKMEVDSNS